MHELTMKNGKAEMAYAKGIVPWHQLGQELADGADIAEWQKQAGMDWRIVRTRVRYAVSKTETRIMDDRHVLVRSDTKDALSIVSDSYKVVQPGEVLEFFRDLTDAAGFKLETAGTLHGGRKFWAMASTGQAATIADPKDKLKGYLLLSTSCDGSMQTEARYTSVCVVCDNTLSFARRNDPAKVKVSHRSTFRPDEVKDALGVWQQETRFEETIANMRRLAEVELRPSDALMQTAMLFEPKASEMAKEELLKVLESKPVRRIGELMLNKEAIGSGLAGRSGTQWAWLNAVTQYYDWEARARSIDNRVNNAWFGNGDEMKTRAYDMALASLIGV